MYLRIASCVKTINEVGLFDLFQFQCKFTLLEKIFIVWLVFYLISIIFWLFWKQLWLNCERIYIFPNFFYASKIYFLDVGLEPNFNINRWVLIVFQFCFEFFLLFCKYLSVKFLYFARVAIDKLLTNELAIVNWRQLEDCGAKVFINTSFWVKPNIDFDLGFLFQLRQDELKFFIFVCVF